MGIKFSATYSGTIGAAPIELMELIRTGGGLGQVTPKLLRFWLMCTDSTYPPGQMLQLEVLHCIPATPGSGGSADSQVSMQQDNQLQLTPFVGVRAMDTVLVSGYAVLEYWWRGGMQVWQGVDIVMSGEPSFSNNISVGTKEIVTFRLAEALSTPVQCDWGMIWEENY